MHRPSCDSAGQARLLKSNMLVPPVTVAKTDDSDLSFCLDAEVRARPNPTWRIQPTLSTSRALPHARRRGVRVDSSFADQTGTVCRGLLRKRPSLVRLSVRRLTRSEGPFRVTVDNLV